MHPTGSNVNKSLKISTIFNNKIEIINGNDVSCSSGIEVFQWTTIILFHFLLMKRNGSFNAHQRNINEIIGLTDLLLELE